MDGAGSRGVRLGRAAARGHVLRGAARRARAPPRQPRVRVAERDGASGRTIRADVRGDADVRAGRVPARGRVAVALGARRRRRAHALQRRVRRHLGLGFPRLLPRRAGHVRQSRRAGGRRVRPAAGRRRHQGAARCVPDQRYGSPHLLFRFGDSKSVVILMTKDESFRMQTT